MTTQPDAIISNIRFRKSPGEGETKQSNKNRDFGDGTVLEPEFQFADLISIYQENNTARKSIEIFAKNVASGWDIIDKNTGKDSKQRDEAIEIFNNCNPDCTFEYLIKELVIDLEATGNAGLEIARAKIGAGGNKKPSRFFNIPIDTLRIAEGGQSKGFKTGQRFVQNANMTLTSAEELVWFNRYYSNPEDRVESNGYNAEWNDVMWFKLPNPRSIYYGQSPSVTLLRNYLVTKYAEEYNISEFESGMLTKFLLLVKNGSITEESAASLKEFISEIMANKSFNTIPILNVTGQDVEASIERLTSDTKEGSYLELMKYNREEVYIAFGVPPIMLGIVEDANRSNSVEQERKFYEKEIIPLQKELAYRFTRMLQQDFGYKDLEFIWNAPDFRDIQIDNEIGTVGVQDGSLSINEKRGMLGLEPLVDDAGNPIDGADKHIVTNQFGMMPVEELGSISSEGFAEKMGEQQAKMLFGSISGLTKKVKEDKQTELIRKGIDDEDNVPEGEYPNV